MFEFGSGTLFGYPIGGNTAPNTTPTKFGTLQDVSLDILGDVKRVDGQNQFPEAVASGKCKITGKAKSAWINGKMYNDLFFGQTLGSGMIKTSLDEAATVPATPFQVTVVNAAQFKQDWGVRYTNTGIPLTRVASAPAVGQYSVNTATGVYTFAAADTGAAVLICYTFVAARTGSQMNITNQLKGFDPAIQMQLQTQYNNNQVSVILY